MSKPHHFYLHVGSVKGSMTSASQYCRIKKKYSEKTLEKDLVNLNQSSNSSPVFQKHDRQSEVRECGFIAPHTVGNDPFNFWYRVDSKERKGGEKRSYELGKHIVFSLPNEFSDEQCVAFCDNTAKKISEGYGWSIDGERYYTVVDWAYHYKPNNKHAHVLISIRAVNLKGEFADRKSPCTRNQFSGEEMVKFREKGILPIGSMRKYYVEDLRREIAENLNIELKKMSLDLVDHRSYERQGIDLVSCIYLPREQFQKYKDSGHRLLEFRKLTNEQIKYEKSEKEGLGEIGKYEKTVARERSEMVRMGEKQVQTLRGIGDEIELRKRKADGGKRKSDRGEQEAEKSIGSPGNSLDRRVADAIGRAKREERRIESNIGKSNVLVARAIREISRSKVEATKNELLKGPLRHVSNAVRILAESEESILAEFGEYFHDWDGGKLEDVYRWTVADRLSEGYLNLCNEVEALVNGHLREYPNIEQFSVGVAIRGYGVLSDEKKGTIQEYTQWMGSFSRPYCLALVQAEIVKEELPMEIDDLDDYDPDECRIIERMEDHYWFSKIAEEKTLEQIPARINKAFEKSDSNLSRIAKSGQFNEMIESLQNPKTGKNQKDKNQNESNREQQMEYRKELIIGR